MFLPKMDKVTKLRILHNEKFYEVYPSWNIIRASKPRKLKWARM